MIVAPACASVRFYAELNDHLAPHRQYQTLEKEFFVPASVKDVIESFGIPHTEIELVLVNGESSDFSRLVRGGDRVAVYPVFESLDITPESLAFYDLHMKFVVEPGEFEIMVGNSSRDADLQKVILTVE